MMKGRTLVLIIFCVNVNSTSFSGRLFSLVSTSDKSASFETKKKMHNKRIRGHPSRLAHALPYIEGLEAANHPKHGVGFHQPSTWGARNAGAPSTCVLTLPIGQRHRH